MKACSGMAVKARRHKVGGVVLALTMLAPVVGDMAQAQHVEMTACAPFGAWSNDPDPKGLNVRAAPSANAKIIGRLPGPDGPMAASMTVYGYRDGWFLIQSHEESEPVPMSTVPLLTGEKRGWVAGSMLMLEVYDPDLRAAPRDDARVIAQLRTELRQARAENPGVSVTRLLECRGAWRHVATNKGTGWVRETCGNPVTTCP